MISQLTRNALKGQQQLAQGSALGGKEWELTNALQGQKLLHFQRAPLMSHAPPRALPWAMSGLAFQAALCLRLLSKLLNSRLKIV